MSETSPSFVAPEGAYTFLEEHKPPHITATAANAAQYPTRISSVTIRFPTKSPPAGPGFTALLGGNKDARAKEKEKEKEKDAIPNLAYKDKDKDRTDKTDRDRDRERDSLSSSENEDRENNQESSTAVAETGVNQATAPTTLFSPTIGSAAGKRKGLSSKKMQSIKSTSSSFVTRLQTVEGLNKILAHQTGEATYLFYNSSKSFIWTQVGQKMKEPLARVTFSACPTCHDVNKFSSNSERIDVVVGFSTGDIICFDPISSRYVRINKQPANVGTSSTSHSACTAVRWVPSSANLFVAAYADGTIVVFDRDRDDGQFTPKVPPGPLEGPQNLTPSTPGAPLGTNNGMNSSSAEDVNNGWDPLYDMFVTPNPPGHEKMRNPVSHWRVSKKKITDLAFSPNVQFVAVVSEDGCLRVIDAFSERLVDTYSSYFGYLTTVTWSPDGRFILTGGQDDLITILSPTEQRVIARCQGHSSFVASVAFDHTQCDGRTYRFGSVGEDNRLLLWDFSSGALHRPKVNSAFYNRASLSSTISLALRRRNEPSTLNLPFDGAPNVTYHPAPPRSEVSVLQPIQATLLEGDLLTRIEFTPTTIVTSTRFGLLRLWSRPSIPRPNHTRGGTVIGPNKEGV